MKKWVLITLLVVGTISLFLMSGNAFAFGRRGGRCGGIFRGGCAVSSCAPVCNTVCNTVCTPVVAVVHEEIPVFAYPVLVPAFQFQYVPTTYAVPTVPVTGYPQAYPVVPQAAYGYPPQVQGYGQQYGQPYGQQQLGVQPQYGMQQQYGMPQQQQPQLGAAQNRRDQIRELAKALIEEMNKIAAEDNPDTDNGPPAVPQPPQPIPQPQPPHSQAPRQPDPQLTQVVLGAFGRTCSHCHTGVGAKGDFQIYTQPGFLNQSVNWTKVKNELVAQHMPPKETQFQLSGFERQSILTWLKQIGVN